MNMVGMVNHNNQNVYIASLPRSGSTLLGMILNQHSECFYIGESFYWNKLNPKNEICSCGSRGCSVLLRAYNEIKNDPSILKITNTVTLIDSVLQTNAKSFNENEKHILTEVDECHNGFNNLTNIFRKITKKRCIIDTSANIIVGKELCNSKDWKIIILLRDPRGIISSLKNSALRHGYTVPKDLWHTYLIDFAKRAIALTAQYEVIIIRYEELCNDPSLTIRNICDYLDIEYYPDMLRYRKDRGHVLMANRIRLGDGEIIKEDTSWISSLTHSEKEGMYHDVKLSSAYKDIGYKLSSGCDVLYEQ